jgi:hypothetical protein
MADDPSNSGADYGGGGDNSPLAIPVVDSGVSVPVVDSGIQNPIHDEVANASGLALDTASAAPTIAPLDLHSSLRIAQHAGFIGTDGDTGRPIGNSGWPQPPIADVNGPMPATPVASVVPPDVRYDYGEALKNGDVNGPQDFAERLAGRSWQQATGGVPSQTHDTDAAQLTNAAKSLAGGLPDPNDTVAYASYIANKTYGTTDPTIVSGIADNLTDAWRDTGASTTQIMQRANQDPAVMSRLAQPQPIPWQQSPYMPSMQDMEAEQSAAMAPAVAKIGAASLAAIQTFLPMKEQGEYEQQVEQRAAEIAAETGKEKGAAYIQAANEAGVSPAAQMMLGGNMEGVAGLAGEALLGAAKRTILQAGLEKVFGPTFGTGAPIAEEAKSMLNQTAGNANNIIQIVGSILDEGRPLMNPHMPGHLQYNDDLAAYVEGRTAAKENFIANGGKEADFTYGPPPANDIIQDFKDHVEDRPGGGRIPEGHELYDLAEAIRGINVGMRQEIERNFDVNGYIDNYYRGNYQDPAAIDRAFGPVGRAGDTSSFQRRTIPYNYEAKMRGLTETFPDALDNTLNDVGGKAKYLAFEQNIQHMVENGRAQWGRQSPMPGWVKARRPDVNGQGYVERKPVQPEPEPGTPAEPAQGQITDTRYDAEMANKVAGPAPQEQLGAVGRDLAVTPARGVVAGSRDIIDLGAERQRQGLLAGPGEVPPETPALVGRSRLQTPDKEYLWMHPASAQIFNNMMGRGLVGVGGSTARALQIFGNFTTATHLLMAGGHLMDMGWETLASGLAHGFGEVASGISTANLAEVGRGLMDMGFSATIVPRVITNWRAAKAFEGTLLDKPGANLAGLDPRIRQLYIDTNAQMTSRGSVLEIGQAKNLVKAYEQGGLAIRAKQLFTARGNENPYWVATKGAAQLAGDALTTASAPMFDHIAPKMKLGMWLNEVGAKLRQQPDISYEELRAWGNKLTDAADNRFGEMNQDRLFFSRVIKQIMNAVLLSTGWKLGTWRQFKGSLSDVAHLDFSSPNARWLMAAPIAHTLIGQFSQYIATGGTVFNTGDYRDLLAPRNGDTLPSGEPGRYFFLSPFKELFDLYDNYFYAAHSPDRVQAAGRILTNYFGEAANPGMKAAIDYWTSEEGQGWRQKVLQDLTPITWNQTYGGATNTIGHFASWLSFRPGARAITDPAALADVLNKHSANVIYQEQLKAYKADQASANPTGVPKPVRKQTYETFDTEPTAPASSFFPNSGRTEEPPASRKPYNPGG